jgi:hypothetical protein
MVDLDLNKTQESRSSDGIILITAVSSSVVTFLVISILILLATGFACFVRRRYKQSPSSSQPTEPLYEDVNVLPAAVEHQELGLELIENVTYGSAKPKTH